MSTHNICFHGEIRKYYVDTPSYLELRAQPPFSCGKKKKSKSKCHLLKRLSSMLMINGKNGIILYTF